MAELTVGWELQRRVLVRSLRNDRHGEWTYAGLAGGLVRRGSECVRFAFHVGLGVVW